MWLQKFFNWLLKLSPPKLGQGNTIDKTFDFIDTANSKQWDHLIIHHSATVDGDVHDFDAIKKYHMSWRYQGNIISEKKAKELLAKGTKGVQEPWIDIGYNFLIEKTFGKYVYKIGRKLSLSGAHTLSYNNKAIGICCVGSFDKNPPNDVQWKMTLALTKELMKRYNIIAVNVLGHRETYKMLGLPQAKTCPGEKFSMEKFRSELV